jgi:hypothetical protein
MLRFFCPRGSRIAGLSLKCCVSAAGFEITASLCDHGEAVLSRHDEPSQATICPRRKLQSSA